MAAITDPRLADLHGQDCSCGCAGRYAGQQDRREDPTRTKTARRRFAQHLRGRFDAIKFHINRGIVDNDAFGLRGPDVGGTLEAQSEALDREFEVHVETDDSITPGAGQFDFPSSSEAAEEFEGWLDEAIEREILEEYDGDRYIRKGYGRGVKHGDARMREAGVDVPDESLERALRHPVHEDKLELMYTRAFEELEGITAATAQSIRRELTDGLSQGMNPREIARNINDRVEAIGKTRATVMARTEVIRSHSEGTLDRYERMLGETDVTIQAELSTSADSRVCQECAEAAGRGPWPIDEFRGSEYQPPIHPQCRCAVIPVTN
ncbi:phage head morphogenesis protein [Natronobacterium gregoryi]|uniref:Phage head morphogenesis protein n=2 Tax=Natronobacterium gregoryi TaxID=44930 RepID=L0AIN0_NATGS|nr:phage minor head protein [Natronobacterium gregoryi]AFZ73032.1 phage putative head morphogenesis protein, SPP1 gp7 family [Natronobacterium gregoryi SP2]ELY70705.1 hypothetical protein C490_06204 [Natronobacterium gregoryi SP2]PLK20441.1 phage head morphogenesis protein [Natronobacterium gregoryi SP2]SFI63122.1 phage putative head morphogenesis protein, SPP1 gp7 family [Natronobacterium gregoryi]